MHNSTTAIIISPENNVLMQLRDDGNGVHIPYPNMWNFPGGRNENGESEIECLTREMREEFELEVMPEKCKKIISYRHDDATHDAVFVCHIDSEPELPLHEGAAIKWMSLSEIKRLELGFDQEKIIPHLETYLSKKRDTLMV